MRDEVGGGEGRDGQLQREAAGGPARCYQGSFCLVETIGSGWWLSSSWEAFLASHLPCKLAETGNQLVSTFPHIALGISSHADL